MTASTGPLGPLLPGVKVPVVHPAGYAEDQPIPAHALLQFQGNPLDNLNVLSPVPEWLWGRCTQHHQTPGWEGDRAGDIFLQENWLCKIIIGYAAKTTRAITINDFWAPRGLKHGLAEMHDEVMDYVGRHIRAVGGFYGSIQGAKHESAADPRHGTSNDPEEE